MRLQVQVNTDNQSEHAKTGCGTPLRSKAAPWSPTELRNALKVFIDTGDMQPCLAVLGAKEGRNRLLALQHALRLATAAWERDALEDIAFQLSSAGTCSKAPLPDLGTLQKDLEKLYGPYALRFLTPDTIQVMVRGLWRLCTPPPSQECLLAVLGIELARAVGEQVPVTSEEFGQVLTIYRRQCSTCGGESGGKGTIYCAHCLARARLELAHPGGPLDLQNAAPGRIEALARAFLRECSGLFGCQECDGKPVQPCDCAREVEIPAHPRHGEVLKGSEPASGKDWFCCVRLVEG